MPPPFFVVQLPVDTPFSESVVERLVNNSGLFFSATRTSEELSLVGEWYDGIPREYEDRCTWACIKMQGPMEHSLTGVLAAFTATLKAANIPVFAVSTWNTDYVLVPMEKKSASVDVLRQDGWIFVGEH
ncbi:ACT domain-containing protein [Cyathus striatus]|nr:ACT domain-containing protein [Cyathus striatus]